MYQYYVDPGSLPDKTNERLLSLRRVFKKLRYDRDGGHTFHAPYYHYMYRRITAILKDRGILL